MKMNMYNEIPKIDLSKYIDKSVVTMYDRLVNEYIPITYKRFVFLCNGTTDK